MKLDWGLPEVELPDPGEHVSSEALLALRKWIDHVAFNALVDDGSRDKMILKALVINASLVYIQLIQDRASSP